VRFEESGVVVWVEGQGPEERALYQVTEDGDAFRISTSGGIFDDGRGRFLGPDEWEVTVRGSRWPGTTRLKRVSKP
jgi:hypothetical protein